MKTLQQQQGQPQPCTVTDLCHDFFTYYIMIPILHLSLVHTSFSQDDGASLEPDCFLELNTI